MSEKKVVNRNIAIALGIICIILIALIAYFTVTGIPAQSSYNNLQDQNKQLQNQVNNLTSIMDFANSMVWVKNETVDVSAGRSTNMTFEAYFSGFITASIQSGNASFFLVEVHYQYFNATLGINQDNPLSFDESHSLNPPYTNDTSFPILPSSVEIIISNPAVFGPAVFETVITITYYY